MSFDPTELTGSDIIVDCMLGTGFAGTPREDYANAINAINSTNAYVISADINSGMNGDTGEYDICVRSDLTVTIGYLKKGLIAARASEAIGKISVADIGITLSCKEDTADDKKLGIETFISRR
jgi:NAD(P)H-hydrate epimerase